MSLNDLGGRVATRPRGEMVPWIVKSSGLLDSRHRDSIMGTPLEQLHYVEMVVLGRSRTMGLAL